MYYKIIFTFIISLILFGCTEKSNQPDEVINDDAPVFGSALWAEYPNETWNGNIEDDCYPPEYNCVVVCADKEEEIAFVDFQNAVDNGAASDFYENGPGQDFLPLVQSAYNDLINGEKDIYHVEASTTDYKYAIH